MLLSLDKPTNWRTKLLGVGLSSRFCKAAWQIAHGARIGGEISILPSWACMAISWWRKAFSREILILATGIGRQQTAELFGAGAILSFFLPFFHSACFFVCLSVCLAGWLSVCPCMSVGVYLTVCHGLSIRVHLRICLLPEPRIYPSFLLLSLSPSVYISMLLLYI